MRELEVASNMEFIILGSASGAPTKTRNVSGLAIKKANSKSWCLVDCGEGIQHQLLHTRLSLNNLEAIFITHVHGDHCFGLPGLIASATMSGRTKPLTIVAPDPVREFVEVALSVSQARLSYEINFTDVAEVTKCDVNDFHVEISELSHRVPSFSFHFIEKKVGARLNVDKLKQDGIESGPLWGRIQSEDEFTLPGTDNKLSTDYLLQPRQPRKVIVAGDNDTPSLLEKYAKDTNVLIHEATFTAEVSEKVGKGPQHSTAKSVAQFAEKSGIPNLVLTHFSSRYKEVESESKIKGSILEIENEAREYYEGNLFLAKDLDSFSLTPEGELTIIKDTRKVSPRD